MIFFGLWCRAIVAALWCSFRQPETLPEALAISAGPSGPPRGYRFPALRLYPRHGFIFGAFICYLGTSQQIFEEQYNAGECFSVCFGVLAVGIAIACRQWPAGDAPGMRRLSSWAVRG